MEILGSRSWTIGVSGDGDLAAFALWLRAVETIEVPPSPLVPGPYDPGTSVLPPATAQPHDPGLGQEWLTWWLSMVDREMRPPEAGTAEVWPDGETPDPVGLAGLSALRGYVSRRFVEFCRWRTDHLRADGTLVHRRPDPDRRNWEVVKAVEAALGRRAKPFTLQFTLLPVRDDRILRIAPAHYLVPERVFLGDGWSGWLRPVVERVA
jgi:hypothetical protein